METYRSFSDPIGHVEEVSETASWRDIHDETLFGWNHQFGCIHWTYVMIPVNQKGKTNRDNICDNNLQGENIEF